MARPNQSMNEQFNQQYEEIVETIQRRAIWRVGEHVTELDAFRCRCSNCGFDSEHQRFDIARHRLLFGKSIRQIEAPRPMIRCRRCGVERHARDIDELVVPTTARLRAHVIEHVPPPRERNAELSDDLGTAIQSFREEASGPLCRELLGEIARDTPVQAAAFIESIGRALYLHDDQIAEVVATLD